MLELTDENFEEEIKNSTKPVLVDFWASWCTPCFVLAPILEKVAKEFEDKIIFKKANLDNVPRTAQKFSIEQIPTIILFNEGQPSSGFTGLRPEPVVREWLEESLLVKECKDYADKNGFTLNPNPEVLSRLVKGLLENEKKYGQRYCPCRRVTGNKEEDRSKICPCQWHKEEIEKNGHCLCQLFQK